ncbi:MAG: glycyl-radical enzyme activating protein [Bacteroidales bacterium]
MEKINRGVIFNIKRFSVHDGPGIRTSVFLKGCPLKCVWCHNPEGIESDITIWYNRNICISCGQCAETCPNKALSVHPSENNFIEIDRSLCKLTGDCVKTCPTGAIEFTGIVTGIDEIMNEIRKDILFYQKSGGGVTISGGEPAFQPEFCLGILKACKAENISTAIETCLYCDREVFETLLNYVDLFIVDMKIFDEVQHEKYTGRSNNIIKDNLEYLSGTGKEIIVRIPLIEGITDSVTNLNSIADFVHGLNGGIRIEHLNYNPLAKSKYQKLGIAYGSGLRLCQP